MKSKRSTISEVTLLNLRTISVHGNGKIVFYDESNEFPFAPKRVFYLYDIPAGESRGAHAHKECHQLLVALAGCFEVVIEDGISKKTHLLNQPHQGLHIPPGIWASEANFSGGAICLVLASEEYTESDYIRSKEEYHSWKSERNNRLPRIPQMD